MIVKRLVSRLTTRLISRLVSLGGSSRIYIVDWLLASSTNHTADTDLFTADYVFGDFNTSSTIYTIDNINIIIDSTL